MGVLEYGWNWHATEDECRAAYPCDKYIRGPYRVFMRAIDVAAPADVLYRWVCQLKVAPYSYDVFDNRFRRSPRRLTPGAERLQVGEPLMSWFQIVDFEKDRHVTVVNDSEHGRAGSVTITYAVVPTGTARSRLVVKIDVGCLTRWERLRMVPLAWGDFIMMRKQFLTLKKLSETTAQETGGAA
jgi:hypothetical protein